MVELVVLVEGMFRIFIKCSHRGSEYIYKLSYIMVGGVCSIINFCFVLPNYRAQTWARHETPEDGTILAFKHF